jgi:uncharacterized membrane protein YkvA (DUF1232 family)
MMPCSRQSCIAVASARWPWPFVMPDTALWSRVRDHSVTTAPRWRPADGLGNCGRAPVSPRGVVGRLDVWCVGLGAGSEAERQIGQSARVALADGVGTLLRLVVIACAVLVATWALLAILARTLPAGAAKDLAIVLPACATTARRLRRDPRVPRKAKIAIVVALLWVLSPIDLIPEFLPIIGPLDDVLVVALAFRYAARHVPREVLLEAWPAERRILERLLPRQSPQT